MEETNSGGVPEKSVHSIWESAYLVSRGVPLLRVQQNRNGYGVFVFQWTDDAQRHQNDFLFGECQVNARQFTSSYQALRTRLYAVRG